MRRGKPCGVEVWPSFSDCIAALQSPIAVVEVLQSIHDFCGDIARRGDGSSSIRAPAQGARVDGGRAPLFSNAPRCEYGLRSSAPGQRQIGATAKLLEGDTLDMSVTSQDDLGHCRDPCVKLRCASSLRPRTGRRATALELRMPLDGSMSEANALRFEAEAGQQRDSDRDDGNHHC